MLARALTFSAHCTSLVPQKLLSSKYRRLKTIRIELSMIVIRSSELTKDYREVNRRKRRYAAFYGAGSVLRFDVKNAFGSRPKGYVLQIINCN